VATLSGGERKRLAIARAIALEPEVLLLDEPLTGLDPEALGGLRELLARLGAEGRTMVMVTHQREDVVALGDHLVFMDRGQVVLAGARAELGAELERFFAGQVPTLVPSGGPT
jgi:polar amino acid transport system ATP-binding protein